MLLVVSVSLYFLMLYQTKFFVNSSLTSVLVQMFGGDLYFLKVEVCEISEKPPLILVFAVISLVALLLSLGGCCRIRIVRVV